ncbi:MAG: pyridoxamine 5'-phosphate oxidase [Acidimicrobiia bacterium]
MIEDALMRRTQYETVGIDLGNVDPDPFAQFRHWFAEAAVDIAEANAMVLATSGPDGPSSRAVLLRDIRDGQFVFYTNRTSRKGRDISIDNRVSLLFPWFSVHRQVRIDGVARSVSDEMSDAYFASRPRASRASAVVSPQSEPIPSREWLEDRVVAALASEEIHRPDVWGGYGVEPAVFEFWQGRPNRLHDRVRYRRAESTWIRERLAP